MLAPAALLLCAPILAGCTPPGKGPIAERGYLRAGPVIEALERYRATRGAYLAELGELPPAFLPDSALRVPDRPWDAYPLEYRRTAEGYELTFRYTGPGMNRCTYTPAPKRWKCSGYF